MSEQPESIHPLQSPSSQKLWTKSFIVITLSSFLLFLCLQMLLSPLPSYAKERFHSGDFTLSLLTSLFALSAIVARFLTAALMRSIHRNILLFGGVLIAGGATAAYSFADTIQALLLLRICFGLGFGIASTIVPTLVSQIIPRERIGEGIGYFGLSTSMAMSLGPMIGLTVLADYGFAPLTVGGTIAVMAIIPLLLGFQAIPPQPYQPKRQHADSAQTSAKPKFNTKLLLPALLNALLSVTYGGLLSFLALFGQEVHLNHVGLFFLINVFTVLIIRPIAGRLFDRKGHAAVLIPGALVIVAGLSLLSFATSMPLLIASALLYGLGFGAIQPTLHAWMLRDSAPEKHGSTNSLYFNATDLGVALGSMILGVIASGSSYALMYRYSAGFMVLFFVVYVLVQTRSAKKRRVASINEPEANYLNS